MPPLSALTLPDGVVVRPRGLRTPVPAGSPPDHGLYLGSERTRRRYEPDLAWPHTWLRWPDFRVPRDPELAVAAIVDVHDRAAAGEAVEVGCPGGVGRTGTVLACLAVRAGLEPAAAIDWVRAEHHPRAVETRGQRRWVAGFARALR